MSSVKNVWKKGGVAFNAWLAEPSVRSARIMSAQGFESVLFDLQHSSLDMRALQPLLTVLGDSDVDVIVRVPSNTPDVIGKVLDSGASGIMCPMVNSGSEASAFVQACLYPPLGQRSFGPFLAALGIGNDAYFAANDDRVVTFAQVETVSAIDNIEDIVSTPNLDAVFIGPTDLAISSGKGPVIDYDDEESADQYRQITRVAHAHGVRVGMLTVDGSDGEVAAVLGWGADWVSLSSDLRILAMTSQEKLIRARQLQKGTSARKAL